jgi:hypothetical protein
MIRATDVREFCSKVTTTISLLKAWGNSVFCGEVEFDAATESVFLNELNCLMAKGQLILKRCGYDDPYYQPDRGAVDLKPLVVICLHQLERFLFTWVRPQKAVAPNPRVRGKKVKEQIEAGKQASQVEKPTDA